MVTFSMDWGSFTCEFSLACRNGDDPRPNGRRVDKIAFVLGLVRDLRWLPWICEWRSPTMVMLSRPVSGPSMLDLMATMEPELSRLNDYLRELTGCDPDHSMWHQAWDMVT